MKDKIITRTIKNMETGETHNINPFLVGRGLIL